MCRRPRRHPAHLHIPFHHFAPFPFTVHHSILTIPATSPPASARLRFCVPAASPARAFCTLAVSCAARSDSRRPRRPAAQPQSVFPVSQRACRPPVQARLQARPRRQPQSVGPVARHICRAPVPSRAFACHPFFVPFVFFVVAHPACHRAFTASPPSSSSSAPETPSTPPSQASHPAPSHPAYSTPKSHLSPSQNTAACPS